MLQLLSSVHSLGEDVEVLSTDPQFTFNKFCTEEKSDNPVELATRTRRERFSSCRLGLFPLSRSLLVISSSLVYCK